MDCPLVDMDRKQRDAVNPVNVAEAADVAIAAPDVLSSAAPK
jgi:hypothetical protein